MTEKEIDAALLRLVKLSHDASGWLTLYRDPVTDQLWELDYPHSERHGGGPRLLTQIDPTGSLERYGVVRPL
jgi:hypothetical protein